MIRFAVIGFGYWGPNIVRNLQSIAGADVGMVCDTDAKTLRKCKAIYPHIKLTRHCEDVFSSADIDAVAIVTPVASHFALAKQALENGKHVFIEKPFTQTVEQAKILIGLAEKKKLKIMVDHVFIFPGAVRKIKDMLDKNQLGKLYYFDSLRSSLGLFRPDVNVIWDLATHDFSILDYLIKNKPLSLAAHGSDHMSRGLENVANVTVYYEHRFMAHVSVNWLSPVKIRTVLIGGEKKMLVWDDLLSDEKLKVYDKGVNIKSKQGNYKLMVDYRSGDMLSPRVDLTEALELELKYFLECIRKDKIPINDGHCGLRVLKMLAATSQSLEQKGEMVRL